MQANGTADQQNAVNDAVLGGLNEYLNLDEQVRSSSPGVFDYSQVQSLASAITSAGYRTQYYGDLLAASIPNGYASVPILYGYYYLEVMRYPANGTVKASFTVYSALTGVAGQSSDNFADVAENLSEDELIMLPFTLGTLNRDDGSLTQFSQDGLNYAVASGNNTLWQTSDAAIRIYGASSEGNPPTQHPGNPTIMSVHPPVKAGSSDNGGFHLDQIHGPGQPTKLYPYTHVGYLETITNSEGWVTINVISRWTPCEMSFEPYVEIVSLEKIDEVLTFPGSQYIPSITIVRKGVKNQYNSPNPPKGHNGKKR